MSGMDVLRKRRVMIPSVALGFLLAGCGGSETSPTGSAQSQPSETRPQGGLSSGASSNANTEDCRPGIRTEDGTYCVVQEFGANIFTNYKNPSGVVGKLMIGQQVKVQCREPEATVASANGGWYRYPLSQLEGIDTEKSLGYTPANTFENGDAVGEPINREFDPRIPKCE